MQPSIQISVTIPMELASRRDMWKYLLGESETFVLIAGELFAENGPRRPNCYENVHNLTFAPSIAGQSGRRTT